MSTTHNTTMPPVRAVDGLRLVPPGTDTIEALLTEQGPARPAIVWLLAGVIALGLAALPLVFIDIAVIAHGVVRNAAALPADPGVVSMDAFLTERDVKYVRKGQAVTIQYEAYPSSDWGKGKGEVVAVSGQPTTLPGRTLYKVSIKSPSTALHLGDGREGRISPGMSGVVHITVNRKSLFEMIYQSTEQLLSR